MISQRERLYRTVTPLVSYAHFAILLFAEAVLQRQVFTNTLRLIYGLRGSHDRTLV
jgi:hypothetical protein